MLESAVMKKGKAISWQPLRICERFREVGGMDVFVGGGGGGFTHCLGFMHTLFLFEKIRGKIPKLNFEVP
jgi:hypothetical protein